MDRLPRHVGEYILVELIAKGGMGEVYRGFRKDEGESRRQFAIKMILPEYSENALFRKRFEEEAKVTALFKHPNLVELVEFFEWEGTYCLVMDFISGCNLRDILIGLSHRNERLPIRASLNIVKQILVGLDHARSLKEPETGAPLNITHGDISPCNIVISREGETKLLDFGLAKAKYSVPGLDRSRLRGTIDYMSPEQIKGQPTGPRSDVFSVGAVLFELLTGKSLFSREFENKTIEAIELCELPKISELNPEISPELEATLRRALSREASERFANAGEFNEALTDCLQTTYSGAEVEEIRSIIRKVVEATESSLREVQANLELASPHVSLKESTRSLPGESLAGASVDLPRVEDPEIDVRALVKPTLKRRFAGGILEGAVWGCGLGMLMICLQGFWPFEKIIEDVGLSVPVESPAAPPVSQVAQREPAAPQKPASAAVKEEPSTNEDTSALDDGSDSDNDSDIDVAEAQAEARENPPVAAVRSIPVPAITAPASAAAKPTAVPKGTGTLTLTVSADVQAYNRKKFLGTIKANHPWSITLSAKRKHLLRFKNVASGIDVKKWFVLRAGNETHQNLVFDKKESTNRKASRHKNAGSRSYASENKASTPAPRSPTSVTPTYLVTVPE